MDGIFLHASWRSSGTWLWERLRNQPSCMGFYEPLHEYLPGMTARRIAGMRSTSWQSRHPEMATPYFAAYTPLLNGARPFRKGVKGAAPGFSFDRFFLGADESHPELQAYIQQLCDVAHAAGQTPVLKFARSQGRLAWFAANFPTYRHALLLRQPWTQFRSGWRCLAEDENPYFLAAPFMVLERNTNSPDVAALIAALGLPIQPSTAPILARLKHWLATIRSTSPETLYKAAFALWLLNAIHALPAATLVLDGDAPPSTIAAPFGLDAGHAQRPPAITPGRPPHLTSSAVQSCHAAALAALAHRLTPALRARISPWLAAAEVQAARDLAVHIQVRALAPAPGLLRRAAGRLRLA
jgi:hypothetical protein